MTGVTSAGCAVRLPGFIAQLHYLLAWVTLGKWLNLPDFQSLLICKLRDNNSSCVTRLLWESDVAVPIKHSP